MALEEMFFVGQPVIVSDKGHHLNGQTGRVRKNRLVPVDVLKRVEEFYVVFDNHKEGKWLRGNQLLLDESRIFAKVMDGEVPPGTKVYHVVVPGGHIKPYFSTTTVLATLVDAEDGSGYSYYYSTPEAAAKAAHEEIDALLKRTINGHEDSN